MKRLVAVLLAAGSLAAFAPSPQAQPAAGPDIRLVLLIAVDQFRYDYLTRFRSEYTDGHQAAADRTAPSSPTRTSSTTRR